MFRARLISPALVLMKRKNSDLDRLGKIGSELLKFLDAFFESGDDRRLARLAARQPLPQAQLAPGGEDGQGDEVDGGGHLKSGLK